MRNFKIGKRTKPIFISKAAFINVTLLTGILVFVALAALTGKAVSDNIIKGNNDHNDPAVSVSDGEKTVSGTDTDDEKTSMDNDNETTVSIDGKEYYLVQFGMFTSKNNADICANSIKAMGGAGYVRQINGNYYVFAMCYEDMADARTVVTQLKSQGYSTLIKSFSHNGLSMKLTGNEIGISSIEAAMKGMTEILPRLEDVIYSFDKKESERTTAKTELQKILEDVSAYKDVFNKYSDQKNVGKIEQFERAGAFCDGLYSDIAGILKADSDNELSSGMKYIYINNVFNLIDCIDNNGLR